MAEIAVLQEFFIYFDQGVKRSEFPLQANFSNLAQQYLSTMRRIASRYCSIILKKFALQ